MNNFFPPSGPADLAASAGFRFGNKGTHSSRTLMLADLETVLMAAEKAESRAEYAAAIVEENCLAKPTAATRRSSNQRLGELYMLNQAYPLFRVFKRLWQHETSGRPLLSMLVGLARDPLFMASAPAIIHLPEGVELQRLAVREAIHSLVGERLNDSVIDKIVRNVSSSWTQTGHLTGRTFKVRCHVKPTPLTVAFALYLGHLSGFHGDEIIKSSWLAVQDCSPAKAQALALEAKRMGYIDLRTADDVIEFNFSRLDSTAERQLAYGTN